MFPNNPVLAKLGMVLIGIACVIAAYTTFSIQGLILTEATVVRVVTTSGGNRTPVDTPVLSFVDGSGQKQQSPHHYASSLDNYKIGTRVNIYYDPEDLSSVRIAGATSLWRLPLLFSGLGLFILWLATKETVKIPPKRENQT